MINTLKDHESVTPHFINIAIVSFAMVLHLIVANRACYCCPTFLCVSCINSDADVKTVSHLCHMTKLFSFPNLELICCD